MDAWLQRTGCTEIESNKVLAPYSRESYDKENVYGCRATEVRPASPSKSEERQKEKKERGEAMRQKGE
jgi:hypothetical protein